MKLSGVNLSDGIALVSRHLFHGLSLYATLMIHNSSDKYKVPEEKERIENAAKYVAER